MTHNCEAQGQWMYIYSSEHRASVLPRSICYASMLNSFAFSTISRPIIRPNKPRTELKISITKTLTNLT
jgi:hypothetical protein